MSMMEKGNKHDIIRQTDAVRPDYYQFNGFDVFDIADAFELDMQKGTAIKYILRAGKKSPNTHIQDLRKAIRCIEREIEKLEKRGLEKR